MRIVILFLSPSATCAIVSILYRALTTWPVDQQSATGVFRLAIFGMIVLAMILAVIAGRLYRSKEI